MYYLIHGDDFGRTEGRTEAIDQLLCAGLIQRTTLLVNMPYAEKAAELAEKHNYRERVAFHMNLSEGTPLTTAIRKTALCKADGTLRWAKEKRLLLCLAPSALRAIRGEVEAQMQRFRELGFSSGHIDSHDWILYNYPVWLAVKPLLGRYGFETTRVGCENWIRGSKPVLKAYRRFMASQIGKKLRTGEDWAGGLDSVGRFAEAGELRADMRLEIMTHPDLVDGVPCDSLHHKHVPMVELTRKLAQYAAQLEAAGGLDGRAKQEL